MRRGEAGKHLRTHGRWMRPSERIVFLILLERSDNADCSVPGWRTPSLDQLADETRYTISATKEALAHLEKHGWLIRQRSAGGRGRKSAYQLSAGQPCTSPTPAACLRPRKQADGSARIAEKQADGSAQKQADEPTRNGRSDPVSDQGLRRGRVGREDPGTTWPAARIPGVRGDIIPAEPATRRALHLIADALGPVTVVSDEPN